MGTERGSREAKDGIHAVCASQKERRRGCCQPRKILVFFGAFYHGIMYGGTLAWSAILYVEWMTYFHTSKGATAWVSSINIASVFIFGIVHSWLIDLSSCRTVGMAGGLLSAVAALASSFANGVPALCVTYGLLNGFGVGMMFLSSVIIIQQHFKRWRAVAAALALGGASFGSLIAGFVMPRLLAAYGWRGTMWIVAGLLLNGVVAGALFFPVGQPTCDVLSCCTGKAAKTSGEEEEDREFAVKRPIYKGSEASGAESGLLQGSDQLESDSKSGSSPKCDWVTNVCDASLLKDIGFLLYLTGSFTFNVSLNLAMQHLVSAAIFKGVDPNQASFLISVLGFSTLPSYFLVGFLGSLKIVNSVLLYGLTVAVTGLVVSLMFLVNDFHTMCIFATAFGVSYSATIAIQPTAMVDLVGLSMVVKAGGLNCLAMGSGCLLSVPFAGFLVDVTNDYNIPYGVGGVIGILGGIMTCLVLPITAKKPVDQSAKATSHDLKDQPI